jgi:hypothetical protein
MERPTGFRQLALALLVCLAGGLATTASAAAQEPGADGPAVDQYVESVPTARGDEPLPEPDATQPPAPLPPDVQERLDAQGGEDAEALGRLAGGSERQRDGSGTRRADARSEDRREREPSADEDEPTVRSASAAGAATDAILGGGATVVLLVLGFVGVTGLLLAAARRRRAP